MLKIQIQLYHKGKKIAMTFVDGLPKFSIFEK